MIGDLRQTAQTVSGYPPILFFMMESSDKGRETFNRLWPEARVVSDMTQQFYKAFGLGQGEVRQVLNPATFLSGVRAAVKGSRGSLPTSDPWMMPGLFLVQGDQIIWQHKFKHIGDTPDYAAIPARLAELAGGNQKLEAA